MNEPAQQLIFHRDLDPGEYQTSDDRYTPPEILDAVAAVWPSGIDLDPFWSPLSLVEARVTCQFDPQNPKKGGGFAHDWWGADKRRKYTVFCNGPWSEMPDVISRAYRAHQHHGSQVIVVCKLDTSTEWWRGYAWRAQQVCFAGRIRFLTSDGTRCGTPAFETAVLNFGSPLKAFAKSFSKLGKVMSL